MFLIFKLCDVMCVFENKVVFLSRAWQGYFHNKTAGWVTGSGYFCPPSRSQRLRCRFTKFERCSRDLENLSGEIPVLLTSGSPMASQARSKQKCLAICHAWICRALFPYQIELYQYTSMASVWDVSKYYTKVSVSTCNVKVIKTVMRSKKGQTENFAFGWCDTRF